MQRAITSYPTDVTVEPQLTGRDRLTTLFRFFLAIPHLFLAGALGGSIGGGANSRDGDPFETILAILTAGVLNIAAAFLAFLSWFAILFTGKHPKGFWDFEQWTLRWQLRATAYLMLLRDEYPPFGEGEYPAQLEVAYPEESRNRVTVAFRLFMALPHIIVLVFLNIAWAIVTFIAWFAILFTGNYPDAMYGFSVGVMRWNARVTAYMFLLRDEYPPFELNT